MEHMEKEAATYTEAEGRALGEAYMKDPSDVRCPECGAKRIEVIAFVDAEAMDRGDIRSTSPDGHYLAILFCNGCRRSLALDLNETASANT